MEKCRRMQAIFMEHAINFEVTFLEHFEAFSFLVIIWKHSCCSVRASGTQFHVNCGGGAIACGLVSCELAE